MPIQPKSGEREQEFISRCISTEIDAGYEQDQAAAICYSVWRESRMSKMTTEQRVANKIRGIDLNVEENLIEPNPCQPGYEAYGTKIKNGREVPNCVSIED